jgi:hypothetical protein
MSKIIVNLRVVGLYFKKEIPVVTTAGKRLTVKDVLEAAKSKYPVGKPGGFDYVAKNDGPNGAETLYSFTHNVPAKTVSSVTKNPISPGQRSLSEIDLGSIRTVWQYYVLDDKNTDISGGKLKKPFGAEPDYEIGNDYTIVVRNIVITKAQQLPSFGPNNLSEQKGYPEA